MIKPILKSGAALAMFLTIQAVGLCFCAAEAQAAAYLTVGTCGSVDPENVEIADQTMDLVPEKIQKVLRDRGWTACVSDEDLDRKYMNGAYGGVSGIAIAYKNMKGGVLKFEDRPRAVTNSVPHEVGHAVDYELGNVSDTPEFERIYRKEAQSFYPTSDTMRSHLLSSQREYFAGVFDEYCRNPENCAEMVPESYEYMRKMASKMEAGTVSGDGWQRDKNGWWYRKNQSCIKNQWLCDEGKWYRFGADGYMVSGWVKDKGEWYYLDPVSGAMATGYRTIGGKKYHFGETSGAPLGALQD